VADVSFSKFLGGMIHSKAARTRRASCKAILWIFLGKELGLQADFLIV